MAPLRLINSTLECPAQEGPHPNLDLPGSFSGHLRGAFFPPWIIGRNSMTVWEVRIVGADWAQEWSRRCGATHSPEALAEGYAAILLERWGPHTRLLPTTITGAGSERLWDAKAVTWLRTARLPHTRWRADLSSLPRKPLPPRLVLHTANILQATNICGSKKKHGHHPVVPP